MNVTRELADIIVGTRFEDLSEDVIEVARQVCLDGLGVIVAGAREPLGIGRITLEYTRLVGGTPEASVIAGGLKTSAPNAAYANGTMCHALDFDNTWWPLNHPTSPSLPAVLALAERNRLSGRDAILALVLAFEVQGRLRVASAGVEAGTGFHKPGVSGTMGAVTAAGKLLGLDAERFCMAFGIAGSRCGSLSANTGTMTKSSHSGHAARMGVEAALLASLGFTACEDVFGKGQFFDLFYGPGTYDISLLLKDFGRPYRMISPGVGFKKHPSNYFTHRPIDAALELRQLHRLAPEDIDQVVVDFPRFDYVNRPRPKTGLDGKFSVQYTTTIALLDGRITVESFADARRFAPDVEALLPRVRLNVRDDIPRDFNETWAAVRVHTRDGRVLEARCDKPRGLWGVPLSREERLAKFRDCVAPALPAERVEEVIALVDRLAELDHIGRLMDVLREADPRPAAQTKASA
ncbi:MAG TPA: MmgE/PrpD family protein [Thermodesulfobacteriota bacterium]